MFQFVRKLCAMRANSVRSSDVAVVAASACSAVPEVPAVPEVSAEVRADGREHEEPSEWQLVPDSDEESTPSLFSPSDDDASVGGSFGNVELPPHSHEESPVHKTLKALFGLWQPVTHFRSKFWNP